MCTISKLPHVHVCPTVCTYVCSCAYTCVCLNIFVYNSYPTTEQNTTELSHYFTRKENKLVSQAITGGIAFCHLPRIDYSMKVVNGIAGLSMVIVPSEMRSLLHDAICFSTQMLIETYKHRQTLSLSHKLRTKNTDNKNYNKTNI